MKKAFLKAALTLLFVFALVCANLPAPGVLSASTPDSVRLDADLQTLCHCAGQPGWVIPELSSSRRPVMAPQLDPTILPVDVSLNDQRTCIQEVGTTCQYCFDCYAWQL